MQDEDLREPLIFISIASYRDPQLVPTIDDLIAKAAHPEQLRFGICWQHGPEEPPLSHAGEGRFRILDVHWSESKGACWARAEIMKLYSGEGWFLQIDSHCRFASSWDDKLIEMMGKLKQAGTAKPMLSTYGTAFAPAQTPGAPEVLEDAPMVIALQRFAADGLPELKPMALPQWRRGGDPVRARFLGAGFLFARGGFVEEVGYDPELYFYGEEASLTVRAYTSGYDMFHPSETLVWHDYIRVNNTRHWDNHAPDETQTTARDWTKLDAHSRDKVRRLLAGESVGRYGLGSARSLGEYEEYAGLSFSLRKAQDYTRRGGEPPNPPAAIDWANNVYQWMARITIDFLDLPLGSLGDPAFWYVAILDERCAEIYRRDFPPSELSAIIGTEDKVVLVCEFQSSTIPQQWMVQPVSKSAGWLKRVTGKFSDGDYSIIVDDDE